MANTVVVSSADVNAVQTSSFVVSRTTSLKDSSISREATSMPQENVSTYMSVVRKQLESYGYSPETISIILSSWRDGTKSQHQSSLNKWVSYCSANDVEVLSPNISQALDFLSKLFSMNVSYSTINTAKSALSSFLHLDTDIPFGKLPIVKRFMKGIVEHRPTFPRHQDIWCLIIFVHNTRLPILH